MAAKSSNSRTVINRGAIVAGPAALAYVEAPWWMIAAVIAAGLAVECVHAVFPQDSPDRLAWWQNRWTRRGGKRGNRRVKRQRG